MAKNLKSRSGIRSVSESRDSSRATPRFCSSKTRPNSLPSGGPISPATIAESRAQTLAGAERPAEHLQRVGQLHAERSQPSLPPVEDPEHRHAAQRKPQDRDKDRLHPQEDASGNAQQRQADEISPKRETDNACRPAAADDRSCRNG